MAARYSDIFGRAVCQLLWEFGDGKKPLSPHAAMARTGVSHTVIYQMRDGRIPTPETVEKFAKGFGQDVDYWKKLAGQIPTGNAGVMLEPHLKDLVEVLRPVPAPVWEAFEKAVRFLAAFYTQESTVVRQ